MTAKRLLAGLKTALKQEGSLFFVKKSHYHMSTFRYLFIRSWSLRGAPNCLFLFRYLFFSIFSLCLYANRKFKYLARTLRAYYHIHV